MSNPINLLLSYLSLPPAGHMGTREMGNGNSALDRGLAVSCCSHGQILTVGNCRNEREEMGTFCPLFGRQHHTCTQVGWETRQWQAREAKHTEELLATSVWQSRMARICHPHILFFQGNWCSLRAYLWFHNQTIMSHSLSRRKAC